MVLSSIRCKKSASRRSSGPTGRGCPFSLGVSVWVRLRAARPRFALQAAGGAAQAAAAGEADRLQQSPAPQHGGLQLQWRCVAAVLMVVQLINTKIWFSSSIWSCWRSSLLRTRSLQRNSTRCFVLWRREFSLWLFLSEYISPNMFCEYWGQFVAPCSQGRV